jgi:hypothetical protein
MLSTDKKLDKKKLKNHISEEYSNKELGKKVVRLFAKIFNNFSIAIDFNIFCDCIEKLFNLSVDVYKKVFYTFLDLNGDGMVCDVDLFGIVKYMDNEKLFLVLKDDVIKVSKEIEKKRRQNGK